MNKTRSPVILRYAQGLGRPSGSHADTRGPSLLSG